MRFIQSNLFLYFFLLVLSISGFVFAVIWPHAVGFYVFITFAAAGGFGVSAYIYHTKRSDKELVCPVGSNCNAVITSRYAKFLGIPIEYGGMFYYIVIFSAYIVLYFAPHLLSELFLFGLIMLTTAAFLFSLYLLFAQAFLLRQWCIWCLLSATLSIVIFITSLASLPFAIAFFTKMTVVIEAVHTLGFVLGIGGATIALFLFARFLGDINIDKRESQTLKGISELIWLGLALVFVSHFVTYFTFAQDLAISGIFLAQTISLFVVAISGAVLMIIIAPFLSAIPFDETEKDRQSPLRFLRRPLFVTGSVAFSSWCFAFILNYLSVYKLSTLLLVYIAVLAVAIMIGLFWEKGINKNVPQTL